MLSLDACFPSAAMRGDRHANERPFGRAVGIILQCSHESGFSHSTVPGGSGSFARFVSLQALMMLLTLSAIGPKRTSVVAPHMSAFGGKADMTGCGCLLSRSLLGVKRTWLIALHMSAYDPKRTWRGPFTVQV